MAGRKQHYIPRSVLRGFLINESRSDLTIWAFVKDKPPFMASINDFAAQRHFYSETSEDQEETLDEKITRHENEFSRALDILRNLQNGSVADPRMVGEVVSHLAIRGAFARDMFKQGATEMIGMIGERLGNVEGMRALLFSPSVRDGSPFERALREEIEKMRGAGFSLPSGIEGVVIEAVDKNFESIFQILRPQLSEILGVFESSLAEVARRGHVQALDQGLVPEAWLAVLLGMRWRVFEVAEPLILPDCIAITLDALGTDCMPFLLSGGQKYENIYMPISSFLMLVGSSSDALQPCKNFNEMAAKCSYSFYVCSVNDGWTSEVASLIGEVSRKFVSSTVKDAVKERFSEKKYT